MTTPNTDLEIARTAKMLPIDEVASRLGIDPAEIAAYGRHKAKVPLERIASAEDRAKSKLILVTAISPTPAGEGKTTMSVGLGDALTRLGKKTVICLREPSLGPCFGMKGGAAGGGHAQVVPMEDINLHFTGDIHAISAANNLLAAMLDNHLYWGNALNIDPRSVSWRRAIDLNDRALRDTVIGLGGHRNSVSRETGFEITAASEVMAIFALATSHADLRERLGRIVVARSSDKEPVTAAELNAQGAMAALLRDALSPNLVQTLENTPAFVHAGPFANIAHGCSSVIATQMAQGLAEYTVTEAGFGSDLGGEKFFNIKCRSAGLEPDAVVLVATIRALKHQGGADLSELGTPDPAAVERGLEHLEKHVENVRLFGVPVVVCLNTFTADSEEECAVLLDAASELGVKVVKSEAWAHGGRGSEGLASEVIAQAESGDGDFRLLYPDQTELLTKVKTVVREIYGGRDIIADTKLRSRFTELEEQGHGHLPVCIAKTQYSFSTDPHLKGRPRDVDVPLRSVQLRAGAGFVLVTTGDIMTMPGLPRRPAAEDIDVDEDEQIVGLF